MAGPESLESVRGMTNKLSLKIPWRQLVWLVIGGGLVLVLGIIISGKQVRRKGTIEVGDQTYQVVLAASEAERQLGLSFRRQIGADGMVFINPRQERSTFWMYGMKFPLDFVWVADGQVVDLHPNVPAPNQSVSQTGIGPTSANDIARITPKQAVDMVIEFPSGTIDRDNITIGTRVSRVLNWYFFLW